MNTGQKVLGGGIIVALLAYLLWPRFFSSPTTRQTSSTGPAVGGKSPVVLAIRFPYVSPIRALMRFDNGQMSVIDSATFMGGLTDPAQRFGEAIVSAVARVAYGGRVYAESGNGITERTRQWIDGMIRQRRPDLDLRWVEGSFLENELDFPL